MKKRLLIFLCVLLLGSCERPATNSSWSPINDVNTPEMENTNGLSSTSTNTIANDEATMSSESTPLPALDLSQFPDPLPESMKGYELVSWQVGETWNFTLVTGTNRMKTFEELMQLESQVTEDGWVKITVSGVDQIKKVLGMLPADADVFWGGMDLAGQVPEGTLYFSYPPMAMMNDIVDFCTQNEINLVNLSEPE